MSTFTTINTAFAEIVTSAYPSMKQVIGTPDDIAKTELAEGQDLFALYANYALLPNELQGSVEQTENFGFYIGKQDTFQSTAIERNTIIAACDVIVNAILAAFDTATLINGLGMEAIKKTPVYKRNGETSSGLWVTSTIKAIVPC